MVGAPTIIDLIRNGTLSAEVAATLWAALDKRLSFVVVAVPRFAGKTTVTNAMLSFLPKDVPVHRLSGDEAEMVQLKQRATGGYLVVAEFSQAPPAGYIWGAPVRRVFDTLKAGYSLAVALHAPTLQETFDAICIGNGVSEEDASRINLMVYIRRFGDNLENFWRRVAEIHEVDGVKGGRPNGRLLYKWTEENDRFEQVESPRLLLGKATDIKARATHLSQLAKADRSSPEDVSSLVASYNSKQ